MEKAKNWIEKYRLALICKDFEKYASLFTRDVEYYDEPFEHSIGDEEHPNDEHFMLCDSMRNFIGSAEAGFGDIEIVCANGDTAVYRFLFVLDRENGKSDSFEFVVIAKFRDSLCKYYYQIDYKKAW